MNGGSASFCTEKERMGHSCDICLALFQSHSGDINRFDFLDILKTLSGVGWSVTPWQSVLGRLLWFTRLTIHPGQGFFLVVFVKSMRKDHILNGFRWMFEKDQGLELLLIWI